MPWVNLPPGCMGFKAKDETRYMAKPGTKVFVEDKHMAALKSQDYAQAGLVDAHEERFVVEDKRKQGRWCKHCNRLWNAWNYDCGKCGEATIPENEMELPRPEGQYHP